MPSPSPYASERPDSRRQAADDAELDAEHGCGRHGDNPSHERRQSDPDMPTAPRRLADVGEFFAVPERGGFSEPIAAAAASSNLDHGSLVSARAPSDSMEVESNSAV